MGNGRSPLNWGDRTIAVIFPLVKPEAMNPDDDALTEKIIGCALQVHRELGPGFLESVYEEAMAIAMEAAGLRFERQAMILVQFHGRPAGQHRLDFLVEDEVVV